MSLFFGQNYNEGNSPVTYTVTFNVTPIDAVVTLDSVEGTNIDGIVIFYKEAGSYNYSVVADGYTTEVDTLIISDTTIKNVELLVPPYEYSIIFQVDPSDAIVTLDGEVGDNSGGQVNFSKAAGSYEYSVTADGYISESDTLVVADDVVLDITLTLE